MAAAKGSACNAVRMDMGIIITSLVSVHELTGFRALLFLTPLKKFLTG